MKNRNEKPQKEIRKTLRVNGVMHVNTMTISDAIGKNVTAQKWKKGTHVIGITLKTSSPKGFTKNDIAKIAASLNCNYTSIRFA